MTSDKANVNKLLVKISHLSALPPLRMNMCLKTTTVEFLKHVNVSM